MIDVVEITTDMRFYDSQVPLAANIVSVQLGNLVYNPTFGVDMRYFLSEDFQFQNEAFKAYVLQRLSEHGVDVLSVTETVEALYANLSFNLSGKEENSGFVR